MKFILFGIAATLALLIGYLGVVVWTDLAQSEAAP
jgi:hypothetical protein